MQPQHHLQKLITMPATLLSALWVSLTGALSFIGGELLTGQGLTAAVVGTISAIFIAWLSRRPAMIKARLDKAQDKRDEDKLHSTEAASVIENQANIHAQEVAWYQSRIEAVAKESSKLAGQADQDRRIRELARISKHNVIEELNHAYSFMRMESERRIEAGGSALPYHYKTYKDMCGEEDEEISRIIKGES
jgi:hypothetical protein